MCRPVAGDHRSFGDPLGHRIVETCCPKPTPEGAVVIEVDEMWHYPGDKANKLWIWTALDRATGGLIDWECGGRDQETFELWPGSGAGRPG